ncbi:MAG: Sua5/YciO/YrdC/YwlC family protein [Bacteroidales bacterium]|nr:Sua5/YciO/YrdC/YwlC family protein [Bacteroidales bacterium]
MDSAPVIQEAVKVLRDGGVILYPTDTVWGIGCDATNEKAVARVFEIKRRSEAKSLVLLACDLDMVAKYIRQIPSIAIDLVEVNDAPMTIIYPGAQYLAPNAVAADGSVGIRIPVVEKAEEEAPAKGAAPRRDLTAGAFCRELVRRLRRPLVSTSANISGEPTPATFAEIPDEIKAAVDYVVPKPFGYGATGRSSQIIKLGLGGEVEILRP